jgi:amino acid transporter
MKYQDAASGRPDASGEIDVAKERGVDLLNAKAVGLIGVLFLTVTGAAPVSGMLGNVPFAIGAGNGLYVPAAFVLATIVLVIFSIGYAKMAGKLSTVGGFYSYISHGLGREVGLAAGIGSTFAYSIFEASLYGNVAYSVSNLLTTYGHITIAWPVLALAGLALCMLFSYFDVKLSTAILGVALIGEVIILILFDVVVFHSPTSNVDWNALNLGKVFTDLPAMTHPDGTVLTAGVASVGIFMAFWSWVGFEMAPNYAEESRDPKRIVPLSLYVSVITLGIFYTLTAWAAVSAYPTIADAVKVSQKDAVNLFLTPYSALAGAWAGPTMNVLLCTSAFACAMAFHNVAARYLYSLGREGVLPRILGRTHPRYRSPHIASNIQSGFAALWVLAFAVFLGADNVNDQAYAGLYTQLAVLGTMIILILQAVVSLAIMRYFLVQHRQEAHLLTTVIAPLVAFIAQAYLVYLLMTQLTTLGGASTFVSLIPYIGGGVLLIGLVWGIVLRSRAPHVFQRIGRLVNNA